MGLLMLLLVVAVSLQLLALRETAATGGRHLLEPGPCEPITIPMCQGERYNATRMPSFLGHRTQDEAADEILGYKLLVDAGCSENMKIFLCSLFAPMCSPEVDIVIPSCQSICLKVMNDCLPTLRSFNYGWPQKLNCSQLPIPSKALCMEPKEGASGGQMKPSVPSFMPRPTHNRNSLTGSGAGVGTGSGWTARPGSWNNYVQPTPQPPPPGVVGEEELSSGCPLNYAPIRRHSLEVFDCVPKCGADAVFSAKDKSFAEVWMTIWASLCLTSTAFTICTFWIDMDRFQYPERAVVFLSLCLGAYSVAYLVRVALGASRSSCDAGAVLIRGGAGGVGVGENSACVVVFLILYFFGIAASVWWVVLTVTWFLAAGKKWSSESIRSLATYFHVAAWVLPSILCVVVVSLKLVDADELTGMCFVGGGGENGRALMGFVVAPQVIFFAIGAGFIVLGFTALVQIRRALKNRIRTTATNVAKLETLMVKILVFSALYAVASVCIIGCWIYEWRNRGDWSRGALADGRDCSARANVSGDWEDCWNKRRRRGAAEVPNLRIFMSLVIGVTSSMWVWSYKTWASWKRWVSTRLCCGRGAGQVSGAAGMGGMRGKGVLQPVMAPRGCTAPLMDAINDPRANRFALLSPGNPVVSAPHPETYQQANAASAILPSAAVPLIDPRYHATGM